MEIDGSDATLRDPSAHIEAASARISSTSPRARMAAALTASLAEAMAVGDLEAARIAHDAIGRLLRVGASGDGAAVVDLAGRRKPTRTD